MPYAIRIHSPQDAGMLVEMTSAALTKAEAAQTAAAEREDAYWDIPDEARHANVPAPHPYPHFHRVSAERAHRWVRADQPHETLLYIEEGRIRRAG